MKLKIFYILVVLSVQIYPQILQDKLKQNQLFDAASTISVTIGGAFPIEGTFPALMTERVDGFITRMYADASDLILKTYNDPDLIRKAQNDLTNFTLRGIILKRSNGEEKLLDLMKFRITGDFENNPYLKNDDVLIFPPNDIGRNFFAVSGAVNSPGTFYYMEGDRLSDALTLSLGINKSYEKIDSVVITRLSYDGKSQYNFKVDLNSDIEIQRGDQIRVVADETQKRNFRVMVVGEVKRPGSVPITKNNTNLSEVITQAGGFTEDASLKRARIYSGSSLALFLQKEYGINLQEQPYWESRDLRNLVINVENQLMYRMSNVYPEDSVYFFLENQLRVMTEGSAVDFTKLDDTTSEVSNYIVSSDDIIVIPSRTRTVYVFGQVNRPGSILYVSGKDYKYYIDQAGGAGELADEEIMVIKGASRSWLSVSEKNVNIEEGDYIYVPKQSLRSFRSYAQEFAIYLGVVASISTILLLFVQLLK